jgi:hydroxymethylbilane synthase
VVRGALVGTHGVEVQIVVIRTNGDRVQDRPPAEIGGKALWTKELDHALPASDTDCPVHSMKDVEPIGPAAIAIAAMLAPRTCGTA